LAIMTLNDEYLTDSVFIRAVIVIILLRHACNNPGDPVVMLPPFCGNYVPTKLPKVPKIVMGKVI